MNYDARVAFTLILAAIKDGGGTVDSKGSKFEGTSGYVVGGKVPTLVVEGTPASADIVAWVRANPSDHYGVWKDSDTGLVHFDAVDVVEDRSDAIRMGIDRGEIAIWDIAESDEIRMADFAIEEEGSRSRLVYVREYDDGDDPDEFGYDPYCGGPEPDDWAGHYDESGY